MVAISVVIPARMMRAERLPVFNKALESLAGQTLGRDRYEIIVVDDGSDVDISAAIAEAARESGVKIVVLRQDRQGPAAARNRGIKAAQGEIILFMGDDIIARANLLQTHLDAHGRFPGCCVTNPILAPAGANEFTRFLTFDYTEVPEGTPRQIDSGLAFCTACVSIPKKWLADDLFDEKFMNPAYEDTELGLRLHRKGVRYVFTRATSVTHDHIHDERSIGARARNCGRAEVYLRMKHPVRNVVLWRIDGPGYNLKRIAHRILYRAGGGVLAAAMPRLYARAAYGYFWALGVEEGKGLATRSSRLF